MSNLSKKLLDDLSNKYGNAFYLLECEQFERNYVNLTNAFTKYYDKFNIAYSYKTNYTPRIVQLVDRFGGYAEVVSEMEMEIALRAGVVPSRIIWNGPIKRYEKVKELLLRGGTVNVDNIYELNKMIEITKNYPDNKFSIGLRLNYDVGDGVISRFGIDVDNGDFDKAMDVIELAKNIQLIGLQAHFAKRNPEYWTARAERMIKVYDKVVNDYGIHPELLDIGGGIYSENMDESLRMQLGVENYSFEDYARRAGKIFSERFKMDAQRPYLFIEPGTALAADCMKFVCTVENIKEIRGKYFATVLGSQKNISVPKRPPIEIIHNSETQNEYKNLDIVGFTCIEGDILYKGYDGVIAIGDYVVIGNCGSYSVVMKPPFILPNFPIVDKNGRLVKRAESFDDLFQTFEF